jgi:hypothetical protein
VDQPKRIRLGRLGGTVEPLRLFHPTN